MVSDLQSEVLKTFDLRFKTLNLKFKTFDLRFLRYFETHYTDKKMYYID